MKTAKITEVFSSIQGEGPYVGTAHVFVRFAGCKINCKYCDTKQTQFFEYTVVKLIQIVKRLLKKSKANYISLTGGEPLEQAEFIADFLKKADFKNVFVYLETNGILYRHFKGLRERIDIVALDIKLPTSTKRKAFWQEHKRFLKLCRGKNAFAKAVITLSTKLSDIEKLKNLIAGVDKNIPLVLQPDFNGMSPRLTKKIINFQAAASTRLKDVRVIPQVHKWLEIQ